MPKISILLSEEQYKEVERQANDEKLTITDFVISKLPITKEKKVTITEVLDRVNNLPVGEFNIPALFTKEEWKSFTKGSRLTIGKSFYKEVEQLDNIEYKRKSSANLAVYYKKY